MSRIFAAVAAFVLLLAVTGSAQTAGELSDTVDQTIGIAKDTQQLKDTWATERAELENRYRTAKATVAWLEERLAVERQRATALDDRVGELRRRLDESGRLQAVIQDSLVAVLHRLDRVVAADMPFLPVERQVRLTALRAELAKPEVTSAEKLRRLLEAMLVEAQYGESVEVSQEKIELAGQETFVDMLRIGRLAMFWRTPDGTQVGTWNPVSGRYEPLPDGETRTIQKAMEMASRMRPVQLLSLPLGRIQP
ncbi:MAG: DUF3450 domain-containing protein [Candidatus Krumholzibacteriia bacterium]